MELDLFPHVFVRASTHPMEWLEGLACSRSGELCEELCAAEIDLLELQSKLLAELHTWVGRLSAADGKSMRLEALELKRSLGRWEPCSPVYRMNPLAPSVALLDCLGEGPKELIQDWNARYAGYLKMYDSGKAAFMEELAQVRVQLRALLSVPVVSEGILLSSQSLYSGVQRYLDDPPAPMERGTKPQRQLERSVLEHLARACTKTVPRGLLTGVGIADLRGGARAGFEGPIQKRKTLLSLPLMRALASRLSQGEGRWQFVVPRSNPSWYLDQEIYFWDYPRKDQSPKNGLRSIPDDPLVRAFLIHVEKREHRARDLLQVLHAEFEKSHTFLEIQDCYEKLCKNSLIIGHLEIPFEVEDGLSYLINWLTTQLPKEFQPTVELGRLKLALALLEECDAKASYSRRLEIYRELQGVFGSSELSDLILVDCVVAVPPIVSKLGESLSAFIKKAKWTHRDFDTEGVVNADSVVPLLKHLSEPERPLPSEASVVRAQESVCEDFVGNLHFSLSPEGLPTHIEIKPSAACYFLNRFEKVTEGAVIQTLRNWMSSIRASRGGKRTFADAVFSSQDRLGNAMGFRKMAPQAIEFFGLPTARPPTEIIPLRDLWISRGKRGWRLFRNRTEELEVVRFQPLPPQGYLRNLPEERYSWLPELNKGPEMVSAIMEERPRSDDLWDDFVGFQRFRKKSGIPRRATSFVGHGGRWANCGYLDSFNPILLDSFGVNRSHIAKEFGLSQVGVKFEPWQPSGDGKGVEYVCLVPFHCRFDGSV